MAGVFGRSVLVLWLYLKYETLIYSVQKCSLKKDLDHFAVECIIEASGADHRPSAPAGGVSSVHLQQVGLQLLCLVLEALSEGLDQTCCAAFVFHQLDAVSWKSDGKQASSGVYICLYTKHEQVRMRVLTTDSGVGLDKHLTSFLPQQYRLA